MAKRLRLREDAIVKAPKNQMDAHLCGYFVTHLLDLFNSDLEVGVPNKKVERWLLRQKLPSEFLSFVRQFWPQTDCEWGFVNFCTLKQLSEDETTSQIAARLLPFKYFLAGFSSTGDAFVIDFSTEACVPGYIPICEWDVWAEAPVDPHSLFEPLGRTFDSFLYRVVEKMFLPVDYYNAKALNQFKAAEQAYAERLEPRKGN